MPGKSEGIVKRGFSGRGLILCVVALILVLLLAAPMQRYLAHRNAVAAARQQEQNMRAEVDDLANQALQWQDPAYIEQQARIRLEYVMPGDTVYHVVGPGAAPVESPAAPSPPADSSAAGATGAAGQSWNERLWRSVEAADRAG
ncbi:MAG: septum formation initiator family protein [Frankiaceae bacterium]|nr:septum formation initiator family protein [Frankiaceae bacterium]